MPNNGNFIEPPLYCKNKPGPISTPKTPSVNDAIGDMDKVNEFLIQLLRFQQQCGITGLSIAIKREQPRVMLVAFNEFGHRLIGVGVSVSFVRIRGDLSRRPRLRHT